MQAVGFEEIYLLWFFWRAADTQRNEDWNIGLLSVRNIALALCQVPPDSKFAGFVVCPLAPPFSFNRKGFAGLLIAKNEVSMRVRFNTAVEEF